MYYPVLPYRDEAKRLIFPLGKWKGHYSNVELRYARSKGYEITPITSVVYGDTYLPFRDFVDDFYKLRKENPENQLFFKLFLNSLYGKWAQSYDATYVYKPMDSLNSLPDNFIMEANGWAVLKEKTKIPPFVNPIFSIYTTAYARIHLHKLMMRYNPAYVDTDSIITQSRIPASPEIGALKLEQEIKIARIVKPKLYYYMNNDDKAFIKTKGFKLKFISRFEGFLKKPIVDMRRFTQFKQTFKTRREILQAYTNRMHIDLADKKRVWVTDKMPKSGFIDSRPIRVNGGGMT
jgi:hypothetical protein